jgi:cysteine desulfurase/selenocysteine lyase
MQAMKTATRVEARRSPEHPRPAFDVERVRGDFPILAERVHGHPLVYLDNAASAQKPRQVIEAIAHFDAHDYSNVHRGVHALSQRATDAFEGAREKVRRFLNARQTKEIVFVRGTTEAINLVAHGYGRSHVNFGDEIIVSAMEHHSNIVPWQMVCQERGATLRVLPMNDRGELLVDELEGMINARTRLVAVVHVSNALGTINPAREIVRIAHAHGVPVLLDGAQAAPHVPVDVQDLDCDFYAFSGHKLYGPSGIGALYGKAEILQRMAPYQGGGEMIAAVTFEKSFYKDIPARFEAGTPNITGAVGLGAAIDYFESVGIEAAAAWEDELLACATARIGSIEGVRLIGTAADKVSVVSFVVDGIHSHDIGTILDRFGVAVRVGHHCAQPVMQFFRVPATARASFSFYNTMAEVDALAAALHEAIEVFR